MSEPVYVGIAVAKATFEVAVSEEIQTASLDNDKAGHAEFCEVLVVPAPRLGKAQALPIQHASAMV